MDKILDGKKLSNEILENIKRETAEIKGEKPSLSVILVGDDPASEVYVASKEKKAKECGFNSNILHLKAETTKEELLSVIKKLNNDKNVDAVLLQLPLPKHLKEADFTDKIDPEKDVDGFHSLNLGKLMTKNVPYSLPCTPYGIMKLLEKYDVKLEGANAVIVGRSNIVGKPLFHMLLNKNATVTVAHSKSKNLSEITLGADILISATGKKHIITKDMVKKGAVVVDVGIVRDEAGKIQGDVDFENVKEVAGLITPVPGGVGPMTIAMLMQNTLDIFKNNCCPR